MPIHTKGSPDVQTEGLGNESVLTSAPLQQKPMHHAGFGGPILMQITPDQAAKWLEKAAKNRNISMARVSMLARDISAGRWRVTGDPIRFNLQDELIDGQHRLWAVVEANIPVTSYVIFGMNEEDMLVVDTGRSRTFGDHLRIRGQAHYVNEVAAIARMAYFWGHGERDFSSAKGTGGAKQRRHGIPVPTYNELEQTLTRYPDLQNAHDRTRELIKKYKGSLIPASLLGFLFWVFRRTNPAMAETWITQLLSGENLESADPVFRLRERMIFHHGTRGKGKLDRQTIAALCIKSFNALRKGKKVQALGWKPKESFPTID